MANFSDFVFSAHSATPSSHLSRLDCSHLRRNLVVHLSFHLLFFFFPNVFLANPNSQFQVYNTCSLSVFLFFFLCQSPLRLRSCHLCIAFGAETPQEIGFQTSL